MESLLELLDDPLVQAAGIIVGSIIAAWLVELAISATLAKAAAKTKTDVDDKIVEIVRRPVFLTVLLWGIDWALDVLAMPERFASPLQSSMQTLLILIWAVASTRIGSVLLTAFAAKERQRSMLQIRTLPVFDIMMRIMVVGTALYFMCLAWHIDLTAWMASAGILGVAFGFAAKDTLANLFSGIFILADGPYKVKDWIVLDNQLRGEVTHIGIRSTRILTPDDVEITVPNAVIGNAQLLNETGGAYMRQRVRISLSVAYGSDIDRVREVLIGSTVGAAHLLDKPAPNTKFNKLGDSGLEFELYVWIQEPQYRERVVDDLTGRVYKALNAAGIEIPYSKHDVYIRGLAPELLAQLRDQKPN
ncbi:Potassium efflux system KefA protein / Small-conductance mechanosensitive channel [Enhygromyxa salina]|uniref:Potassium efflux system KefA protein / Small-conductance mechanosensitive channel n=1 Tax=Enhygromyxa salina TaxID=215803 RepID=A0A0C1Z5Z0_9BACT|nr:mechanosensitive ion channel family protein [Enhygromyxa salina]KIG13054.1 Potassium efflux system KefA protein / Small-conductance mechanosensitive channel [Enhygromyxa salina]